tara:strand:+ start:80 stop:814 length:735 start_codon:yes stop_codon:yes gene_type:complete
MSNTVIIIPSRLKAKRFPNKPLKLINNREMILHVYDVARRSEVGEVLVVTPDQSIFDLVKSNGGKSFISKEKHETGTDRVFEGFKKYFSSEPNFIINLQGDMPNLDPKTIIKLNNYLKKGLCEIGTLASNLENDNEIKDENVVKVITKKSIEKSEFSDTIDFKRNIIKLNYDFIYHHIGIYGFTNKALMRYVSLKRSKLEIERKLEQMRALENGLKIHTGFVPSNPLSVDTENDYLKVKKIMEI